MEDSLKSIAFHLRVLIINATLIDPQSNPDGNSPAVSGFAPHPDRDPPYQPQRAPAASGVMQDHQHQAMPLTDFTYTRTAPRSGRFLPDTGYATTPVLDFHLWRFPLDRPSVAVSSHTEKIRQAETRHRTNDTAMPRPSLSWIPWEGR